MLSHLGQVVHILLSDVNSSKVVSVGGDGCVHGVLIRVQVEACWATDAEVPKEVVNDAGDGKHLLGGKGE